MNLPTGDAKKSQNLAFLGGICFGLMLILQIQVAGDDMWLWSGTTSNHGDRFCQDLQLALQPVFLYLPPFLFEYLALVGLLTRA